MITAKVVTTAIMMSAIRPDVLLKALEISQSMVDILHKIVPMQTK